MEQRERFIADHRRALYSMSELCGRYGISRKTGYKWLERFIAAVRTDNGVPFATTGVHGLSQLNVWWMRLGIQHQRIRPASPQENGGHERMHKTLKAEVIRPPKGNMAAQQRASMHSGPSSTWSGRTEPWTVIHPARATQYLFGLFQAACPNPSTRVTSL